MLLSIYKYLSDPPLGFNLIRSISHSIWCIIQSIFIILYYLIFQSSESSDQRLSDFELYRSITSCCCFLVYIHNFLVPTDWLKTPLTGKGRVELSTYHQAAYCFHNFWISVWSISWSHNSTKSITHFIWCIVQSILIDIVLSDCLIELISD